MRNELLWGVLLVALIGCGSSSGGGTGGTNGGAGASGTGGTSAAAGSAGQGAAAGNAGAGLAGNAGTAGAGATGGAASLSAGTYAGTATGANCVGFPGGTGCPLQITISGSGPTYHVTELMLPGGISGSGVTVTQTGGNVTVDLLTDGAADFCPASEYTGSGFVGAGGTSMSVTLTGPPCGSSDMAFISLTLTRQ